MVYQTGPSIFTKRTLLVMLLSNRHQQGYHPGGDTLTPLLDTVPVLGCNMIKPTIQSGLPKKSRSVDINIIKVAEF